MKARALGLFLALALAASAHAQPYTVGKQDLAGTAGGAPPSGCSATSVPIFLGSPVAMGCDAGLTYDAGGDVLSVTGKLGVGVTGAPGANLEVWGTAYVYSLAASATGSAVQFDSTLTKASTVYGVYTNTIHNSATGDVYGIIANVAKGTGRAGQVIGMEGYVTAPHQADDSRHYGLIGDNRAPANGKTGTINVGAWAIAYGAATDIGLLLSDVPHGTLPASGDYAIYSGDTGYTTHLAGPVMLPNLPVYADNTAALAGGLTAGRVYRTATGVMMIAYTP